jgi:hypothetical protein
VKHHLTDLVAPEEGELTVYLLKWVISTHTHTHREREREREREKERESVCDERERE